MIVIPLPARQGVGGVVEVRLKNGDLISGLIVFGTGLIFYLNTSGVKPAKIGLSPASFPRLITIALMICGVALIVKGALSRTKTQKALKSSVLKRITAIAAMFFAYVYLLDELGFVVLTPFLIFGSAYLFGGKKLLWNALISLLSTFVIYYVFAQVFKVPLPSFSL